MTTTTASPLHPPPPPTKTPDTTTTTPPPQFPLPTLLTRPTPSGVSPILITQGAEARLYKTTYLGPSLPAALKYRPPKPYRHPALDARLTRARILAEARVLAKCRRDGCPVPALYALDELAGWLMLEWIPGAPVRARINEWLDDLSGAGTDADAEEEEGGAGENLDNSTERPPRGPNDDTAATSDEGSNQEAKSRRRRRKRDPAELKDLMRRMGAAIGKMHSVGVVHGDLTTSNMMLRPPKTSSSSSSANPITPTTTTTTTTTAAAKPLDGDVFIIDFGLASQSTSDEDRAVDLYVLERAFGSTHPRAQDSFRDVLDAYRASYRQAPVALRKLEDVRMRGRKRSMIG